MSGMKIEYEKRYKINGSEMTAYFDENGIAKITEQALDIGADYMLQRFLDVLKTEVEPQERSGEE